MASSIRRSISFGASLLLIVVGVHAQAVVDIERATPDNTPALAHLHMNQIQVVGTHNSYHLRPKEPLFSQVKKVYPDAATWDYSHAPLDLQLERGIRSFELDVYADPAGTRVMHVPQFDEESNYKTLVDALSALKTWSAKNPRHVPITVLLELKDEKIPQVKMPILPFDATALDQLDREIRGVFTAAQLLTPDDVRGDSATLSEAITNKGWPLLETARGKVMIILHARGLHAELYTTNAPSLQGRAMFMESQEAKPFASVFICNDPDDAIIAKLVHEGYLVRTRADSDMRELSPARREKALASGAHIVSTDFPNGEAQASGYVVTLPGAVTARVNPLSAIPDAHP